MHQMEIASKITMALMLKGYPEEQSMQYAAAITNAIPVTMTQMYDQKLVKRELIELADALMNVSQIL